MNKKVSKNGVKSQDSCKSTMEFKAGMENNAGNAITITLKEESTKISGPKMNNFS